MKRLQHRHLYIGRGAPHLGCLRSIWANPFKVKEFGREAAIQKFETMLKSSTDLQQKLHQLSDKVLLCHCDPSEACHGDVLISAWEDKFLAGNASGSEEETAQSEELFRAAAMRQPVEEPESQSEDEPGQAPRGSGWRGTGPPLTTGSGSATRELHDGAGLCSPGRWPLDKRRLPDNDTLNTARDMVKNFVTRHLSTDLFAKLACGRVKSCPFEDGLVDLREELYRLFQQAGSNPGAENPTRNLPWSSDFLAPF